MGGVFLPLLYIFNLKTMSKKYRKLLRHITRKDVNLAREEKIHIQKTLSERLRNNKKIKKYTLQKSLITTYDLYDFLQSTFGDNWIVDKNALIVYYPEITVTSENGNTHTIKEVYVEFKITGDSYWYPYLFKAVFTRAELNACYLHSHVKLEDSSSWSDAFCWGSYLKNHFIQLQNRGCSTIEWLYNQVVHTHLFLQQESIEGRPYVAISKIRSRRNETFNMPYVDFDKLDVSKLEIYNIQRVETDKILVDYNRDELLESHPDYQRFLCYDEIYSLDSTPVIKEDVIRDAGFYFGRKKVQRRVVQEEVIEPVTSVHKDIIVHFDNFINNYINAKKYEIAAAYAELYHQV